MSLPTLTAVGHIKFKEYKVINDKSMVSFVLNCSEKKYKGDGYDNLDIKVNVWGGQADFVNQYLNDGDVCEVVGKIETNVYEKQDGTKVRTTQFKFPQVSFIPKPFSHNSEARQTGNNSPVHRETIPAQTAPAPIDNSDEIPF